MSQLSLIPKKLTPVWIKVVLVLWIFLVLFIYLLLFGPPEFWSFIERLGLLNVLQSWRSWLEPFLQLITGHKVTPND